MLGPFYREDFLKLGKPWFFGNWELVAPEANRQVSTVVFGEFQRGDTFRVLTRDKLSEILEINR